MTGRQRERRKEGKGERERERDAIERDLLRARRDAGKPLV